MRINEPSRGAKATRERALDEHKLRGFSTGVPCPMCLSDVEYNGNYFCSECSWVMPEKYIDPWLTIILLEGLRRTYRKQGLNPDHIEYHIESLAGRTRHKR